VADTLSAQIDESTQELIDTTQIMMPQLAPMLSLATIKPIPKGKKELELPFVNSFPTVETPTEGDDLTMTSQFDLASVTIAPTFRVIRTRIHKRAERFSQEQLISLISEWIARAEAKNSDQDLLDEFANFHSDNDIGTSTEDIVFSDLRISRQRLSDITDLNGGPAQFPMYTVLSPTSANDIMVDLGIVGGATGGTSNYIVPGLSQDFITQWMLPAGAQHLLGVPIFWDGNIDEDANGDDSNGMFSKSVLYYASSDDWDLETFTESDWPGPILRTIADFESGVHGYSHHGAHILADGD
jgi:hypothetical protein